MLVEIEDDEAVEMLVERVKYWTSDNDVIDLFKKMYQSYIDSGVFESGKFNIMEIVDNDYVNYTRVICKDETDFKEILKIYEEQGLGDCSCECDIADYIESCDDEETPTMFLVRI